MQFGFSKKIIYPVLTFLLTVLATVLVVYFSYQSQLKYTKSLFNNLAQQQTDNLAQVLDSDLHFIGAGANFFHATKPENWGQFEVFADELVSSSDTLVGLQWMQRVEENKLEAHITTVRETFPNFQLYTVPKDGPKTMGYIMPNHEPIYVASDIYPRTEANLGLLGFYSSRVRFQLILDGIRATGEPNVSDKVRLLQDGLDQSLEKTGMLVYHPVFDGDSRQHLIGVVVGVIRTTRYFEDLMARTASEQDLLIKVTDMGFDAEDDPILYQSKEWEVTQGLEVSKQIELPNREWIVDFKLAGRVSNNDRLVLRSIIVGGFVIACLLGYIVFLQVREKEYLSVMLDERTKELQFMVNHDALTGLLNRRAFNEQLHDLVFQEKVFSLAAFDVDKFKNINDSFGHIVGDEMLIHVAELVTENLAPDDIFVRMGGDEFCIISSITDRDELYRYLNNIARIVALSSHDNGEQKIRCSLSIGAVVRTIESEEDILQLADTQLYKSKKAGRNCVTVAE